jgi:hypothetical protein
MNEFTLLLLRYIDTDISLTAGKFSHTMRSRTVVVFGPFPSVFEGLILINQSVVALVQTQRPWMAPKQRLTGCASLIDPYVWDI